MKLAALASGLVGLVVLLGHLALAGGWRDATELQWAAAVLGVPHPPGSPVYLELARGATLLPFGSIAWRVNLLSALAGAAALAAVQLVAWRLTARAAPTLHGGVRALLALLAPVLLLGSEAFREQGTTAEVYSLQAAGVSVLALGILGWEARDPQDVRPGLMALFGCALATGVHVSFAFYLPVLAVLLAAASPQARAPRVATVAATALVVGACVFLYVPLRAVQGPSLNWGQATTLERTYYHLLNRKDVTPDRAAAEREAAARIERPPLAAAGPGAAAVGWGARLAGYARSELGGIAAGAGLLGLVGLAALGRSRAAAALLGIGALHVAFGVFVGQWASPTGYTPVILLLAAASPVPLAALLGRAGGSRAIGALASLAAVAALGQPGLLSILDPGARADRGADELARELFADVPQDALLLVAHYWPIVGFEREIEGYRTDVDVLFRNQVYETQRMRVDESRHPDVVFPPPPEPDRDARIQRMAQLLELNHAAGRPIAWQSDSDDLYPGLVPDGLLLAYRPGEREPTPRARARMDDWLESFRPRGSRHHWLVGEFGLEEALLPAARYAAWHASRLHCAQAQHELDRVRAVVPPGQGFRPAGTVQRLIRACEDEAGRMRERDATAGADLSGSEGPGGAAQEGGASSSSSARSASGE